MVSVPKHTSAWKYSIRPLFMSPPPLNGYGSCSLILLSEISRLFECARGEAQERERVDYLLRPYAVPTCSVGERPAPSRCTLVRSGIEGKGFGSVLSSRRDFDREGKPVGQGG